MVYKTYEEISRRLTPMNADKTTNSSFAYPRSSALIGG
jgi:hypothetical protein